jgi:hypothetical protein
MESGKTPARHPQDEANFVSRLFLWWITPLLWKGWRHPLQQDDLHPVRDEDQSCKLTEHLGQPRTQPRRSVRAKSLGTRLHLGEKWEQEKDAAKRGIVFFCFRVMPVS